jgi:polyisoprenoid-binding protein YceI
MVYMVLSSDKSRLFLGNILPAAGEYSFDPAHSFAEFIVQHIMVGQVRGRFDSNKGTIRIAEDPLLSSIEVSIDTPSISTHNKDRDTDLRSERFFDVEKFPKITFSSTGIKTEPGGRYTVDGNLTVRGDTRPVSLAVTFSGIVGDPWGKTRAAFQAETGINRKEFGLMADLERETGGFLVGKDVTIIVATEAILTGPLTL